MHRLQPRHLHNGWYDTEWSLEHVYRVDGDEPGTCICTHFPILEICVLENAETEEDVEVSNCCVKRFMDIPSDTIFAAVRRVRQDRERHFSNSPYQSKAYASARRWKRIPPNLSVSVTCRICKADSASRLPRMMRQYMEQPAVAKRFGSGSRWYYLTNARAYVVYKNV